MEGMTGIGGWGAIVHQKREEKKFIQLCLLQNNDVNVTLLLLVTLALLNKSMLGYE